jgi:hypothetical protein
VHVADESNPANPVYELHLNDPDPDVQGVGADYSVLWQKEQVVAK